jgi:hypothetical protein
MICSTFYFLKDTFDGVAVAVCFVAEVHAKIEQAGMQPGRAIDEEFGVIDGVFVLQLSQKHFRYRRVSGWIEAYMQDYVGVRVDRRDQPESVSVDLDDRLVERDLGWSSPATRFEIRLLYPVVDGRSSPVYSKPIKNRNSV